MATHNKFLVMDSGAFIRGLAHLDKFSTDYELITIQEVIGEIRDRTTREKLQRAVFTLNYKEPTPKAVELVRNFCKATGDYSFLSTVDIKIMAVAVTMEIEKNGMKYIKEKPAIPLFQQSVFKKNDESFMFVTVPSNVKLGGLKEDAAKPTENTDSKTIEDNPTESGKESENKVEENTTENKESAAQNTVEESTAQNKEPAASGEEKLSESESTKPSESENENSEKNQIHFGEGFVISEEQIEDEEEDEDDDGEGWITAENFDQVLLQSEQVKEDPDRVFVGCCTTDFAVQNVLLQMGVNLISIDGLQIRNVRNWILRCYACDRVSPDRERVFCKFCGNRTLRKISIFIDESGQVKYVNPRRAISTRGTNFSLPKPKPGRANKPNANFIVTEDQWLKANRSQGKKKNADVFDLDPDLLLTQNRKPNSRMDASNRLKVGPSAANRSQGRNKRNRRRK